MNFSKVSSLKGELSIPGDKSISHRAIMLGAIADGKTRITNFLKGADCLSTIDCFRKMGIEIENYFIWKRKCLLLILLWFCSFILFDKNINMLLNKNGGTK